MRKKLMVWILVAFVIVCMLNLMVSVVAGIKSPGEVHPTPLQQIAYIIAVHDYGYDDAGAWRVASWVLIASFVMMFNSLLAVRLMLKQPNMVRD